MTLLGSTVTLLSASTSNIDNMNLSLDPSDTVNNITNISKAIAEYGPVVVICGVFIVLFILIFLLFMKINNTMVKQMIKQLNDQSTENTKVMNKLLTHLLDEDNETNNEPHNTKPNKTENRDLVGMFIDYNTAFIRESKNVINNLRCDRVAVYV